MRIGPGAPALLATGARGYGAPMEPTHDTPAQRDEKAQVLEDAVREQKAADDAALVVELARLRREMRLMYGIAVALNVVTSAVVVATLT